MGMENYNHAIRLLVPSSRTACSSLRPELFVALPETHHISLENNVVVFMPKVIQLGEAKVQKLRSNKTALLAYSQGLYGALKAFKNYSGV
jgi:hypothetical protein